MLIAAAHLALVIAVSANTKADLLGVLVLQGYNQHDTEHVIDSCTEASRSSHQSLTLLKASVRPKIGSGGPIGTFAKVDIAIGRT